MSFRFFSVGGNNCAWHETQKSFHNGSSSKPNRRAVARTHSVCDRSFLAMQNSTARNRAAKLRDWSLIKSHSFSIETERDIHAAQLNQLTA